MNKKKEQELSSFKEQMIASFYGELENDFMLYSSFFVLNYMLSVFPDPEEFLGYFRQSWITKVRSDFITGIDENFRNREIRITGVTKEDYVKMFEIALKELLEKLDKNVRVPDGKGKGVKLYNINDLNIIKKG